MKKQKKSTLRRSASWDRFIERRAFEMKVEYDNARGREVRLSDLPTPKAMEIIRVMIDVMSVFGPDCKFKFYLTKERPA